MTLLAFAVTMGFGLMGCEEDQADDSADSNNLCEIYASCNACIDGQISEGKTEGEAETQCALAVTGCWVTWDKPVVCGEDTYEEQPD